jgi:cell division septation protein DedD
MSGPDQLALRFPRAGGVVRAFAYPTLDSVVWKSSAKAPPLDRILAFDEEAGSVAAVDAKGAPVRIDLRLGGVSRETRPKLAHLTSSDGSAVYGIGSDGSVTRLTPSGSWTFKPPAPAHDIIPEDDGSLLVLADRGERTAIWQLHPPERSITDTALLPRIARSVRAQAGGRLYFTVDSGLIGVRSRDLSAAPSIRLRHRARALAATPSGDRIYVASEESPEVLVVDRFGEKVDTRIALPGVASELRMDPNGRYVLARPERGDSAWVLAVGTDHRIGTVETAWRRDLPAVTLNGWLALLQGGDVVLLDGETLRPQRRAKGGAKDSWLFVAWNGFRPRAAGLDEPVSFGGDSAAAPDTSTPNAPSDHGAARDTQPVARETTRVVTRDTAAQRVQGYTVQFAAVRSAQAAKEIADKTKVEGAPPRVVATAREGVMIYRVVIGPFATHAEAERVAKTSGKAYWIYQGAP